MENTIKNKSSKLILKHQPSNYWKLYNDFANLSILFIKIVIKYYYKFNERRLRYKTLNKIMEFNKDTKIGEILEKAPEKAELLIEAGMHCIGCPASQGETLEEACMIHGIDVNDLVAELNEVDEEE